MYIVSRILIDTKSRLRPSCIRAQKSRHNIEGMEYAYYKDNPVWTLDDWNDFKARMKDLYGDNKYCKLSMYEGYETDKQQITLLHKGDVVRGNCVFNKEIYKLITI